MNEILRLNQILEYTGMRKNTLAKALGYTNSAIFYQIETGRNGISSNLAIRVSERFPEINQNWILTGKGEMLHDSELNIDEKTKNRIEFLENHLKGQDARIEKLEKLLLDLIIVSNTITKPPYKT
jgi:plasmid maintenance system antidote protein VapI